MALTANPEPQSFAIWRALRVVCPACGCSSVHRSRRRSLLDHLVSLAGIRVFRCNQCGGRHHGTRWLKILAPLPQVPVRSRKNRSAWLRRYRGWRIREGRHAPKYLLCALALLAALGGFFLLLWHSHLLWIG